MTRHSISYIPFHILRGRNMNEINNMVLFFLWLYDYDEYENDCLFNNDNLNPKLFCFQNVHLIHQMNNLNMILLVVPR